MSIAIHIVIVLSPSPNENTDMLSVRINTCRCSSCGRKSLELRTLLPAPSGLCGSDHSPKVGMPSHTAHRPPVDASVVTTTRDVTKPRGTPGWRDFSGTASELRCSRGGPRCANGPKSTPSKWLEISAKTAAGACVVNCPVWKGTGKTNWRPSTHLHCF